MDVGLDVGRGSGGGGRESSGRAEGEQVTLGKRRAAQEGGGGRARAETRDCCCAVCLDAHLALGRARGSTAEREQWPGAEQKGDGGGFVGSMRGAK